MVLHLVLGAFGSGREVRASAGQPARVKAKLKVYRLARITA